MRKWIVFSATWLVLGGTIAQAETPPEIDFDREIATADADYQRLSESLRSRDLESIRKIKGDLETFENSNIQVVLLRKKAQR